VDDVVYVTATPPWPTTSGGRLRTAENVSALARIRPTHLIVLPPDDVVVTPPALPGLASLVVRPVRRPRLARRLVGRGMALARGEHPYLRRWLAAGGGSALRADVDRIGARVVILEFPFYPTTAELLRGPARSIVADVADDRIAVARQTARLARSRRTRWLARLDLAALSRSERGLGRLDQVWFAAGADARRARQAQPGLDVRTIPNVVDVEHLASIAAVEPRLARSVAFLGAFDYPPNETAGLRFAERIVPRLRADGRPARLALIGRSPTERIRRAAALARIDLLADVPDAAKALAGFAVLVAPLESGSGTRLKILEAAALGVPVVSTPIGAADLELEPDVEILIGASDDELAAAVGRLWDEPVVAERISAAARHAVRLRYGRDALEAALEAALRDVPGAASRTDSV
jgi:glycosyltransferase involved in cell wall biosynthesis